MAVVVCVVLAGFFRVMRGMNKMAMRHMGVMAGHGGVAGFVMLGSAPMMFGRVLMMFGGLTVVVCGFF